MKNSTEVKPFYVFEALDETDEMMSITVLVDSNGIKWDSLSIELDPHSKKSDNPIRWDNFSWIQMLHQQINEKSFRSKQITHFILDCNDVGVSFDHAAAFILDTADTLKQLDAGLKAAKNLT